jgi:phage baseplate assembly protein W
MKGMDRITGKPLDGVEHLKQSIRDIMMTSPETRVMRREYGCGVRDLVDAPLNGPTLTAFYAAAAAALDKYEPRLRVSRVHGELLQSGEFLLTVEGYYKHNGKEIILEGITL